MSAQAGVCYENVAVELEDRLRSALAALNTADEELSSRCNKLHPTRCLLWQEIRAAQDTLEWLTTLESAAFK